jgi:hypothetical protein
VDARNLQTKPAGATVGVGVGPLVPRAVGRESAVLHRRRSRGASAGGVLALWAALLCSRGYFTVNASHVEAAAVCAAVAAIVACRR